MKQDVFTGFGPTGATWRRPVEMDEDVLVLCDSAAKAVRWSLLYARRRFGMRQKDVAALLGLGSPTHLSEWKREGEAMPDKHIESFCYATGCGLLAQFLARDAATRRANGSITENERDRVVVNRMLAA